MHFNGVCTALITPFHSDGSLNLHAFSELVEMQIAAGINGLVPCGTTGENATLTEDEYCDILTTCVESTRGRVPVIAGTGTNCTKSTIYKTLRASHLGVDAALVIAPYYNRPNQEGLYQHFAAVHSATSLPIIVYNVPSRCGVDISNETLARILSLPRIVGVKEASGNVERVIQIRHLMLQQDVSLLSGDDLSALFFNLNGGNGCISVTSNIAPESCIALQDACKRGDLCRALSIHHKIFSLISALFCDTNPVPIKYALSLRSKINATVRLPLTELSTEKKAIVELAVKNTIEG